MTALHVILLLVAFQRLAELILAQRNTRYLLSIGGSEAGAGHYPLFILLHVSWLLAIALWIPADTAPSLPLLVIFCGLQAARVWVIWALGRFWTTRVITLEGAPLVTRGPYRWFRHPNYMVVIAEIAVLPLVFGAWDIALVWSALNLLLLAHRVRVEEAALQVRRGF